MCRFVLNYKLMLHEVAAKPAPTIACTYISSVSRMNAWYVFKATDNNGGPTYQAIILATKAITHNLKDVMENDTFIQKAQ